MTDDQLRAMARRVLGLALWCEPGGQLYYSSDKVKRIDELDAAAVAILREEMDREWMAANHLDDDPTQTIVIDV